MAVTTSLYTLTHLVVACLLICVLAATLMPCHRYDTDDDEKAVSGWLGDIRLHYRGASLSSLFSGVASNTYNDWNDSSDLALWRATEVHLLMGFATYLAVAYIMTAPYGRHATKSSLRFSIPSKLSWALQECPTLLNVLFFMLVEYPFVLGQQQQSPTASFSFYAYVASVMEAVSQFRIGMLLFVVHYVHRSIVYPWRVPHGAQRVPAYVTWLATLYCIFNGRLQVLTNLTHPSNINNNSAESSLVFSDVCLLAWRDGGAWILSDAVLAMSLLLVLFIIGMMMFFGGMYVNIRCDYHLVALRRQSKGYVIPRGFWFDSVTSPNYLGEIVEWFGYALVVATTTWPFAIANNNNNNSANSGPAVIVSTADTWGSVHGLAALSFALYVVANLVPRAVAHHAWYKKTFDDYPKERRAIFPAWH